MAKATAGRHLGLIGLLGIIVDWPDPTFLHNLLVGFPSVGFSPHVASYSSQPSQWIPLDDLWDSSLTDASRILSQLRPGPLDDEIVQAGAKDSFLLVAVTGNGSPIPFDSTLLYPAGFQMSCH